MEVEWNNGEHDTVLLTDLTLSQAIWVAWKHDKTWVRDVKVVFDCMDVDVLWKGTQNTNIVSIEDRDFVNPRDFINLKVSWREDSNYIGTITKVHSFQNNRQENASTTSAQLASTPKTSGHILADITTGGNVLNQSLNSSMSSIISTPRHFRRMTADDSKDDEDSSEEDEISDSEEGTASESSDDNEIRVSEPEGSQMQDEQNSHETIQWRS